VPIKTKDAIGFGALNVDLLYEIEDFPLIQQARANTLRGGEYLVTEAEMRALRRLLDSRGRLVAQSGGGQAANVVAALARMGFSTGMVGAVGTDDLGTFLLEGLQGVDTSRVRRLGKSGMCLIAVDETKERTNFVLPNANDALGAEHLDLDYLNSARFVHLSSFAGEAPFRAQQAIVPSLSGPRISFDPGELYCRRGMGALAGLLRRSSVAFMTERELEYLTGLQAREGAAKLLECGVEMVVCKRGRRGAWLFTGEGRYEAAAPEVEVVDPTGAGDVFAAAFLAGLLLGQPAVECARFAVEAASHSVTAFGRERYPDAQALRRGLGLQRGGDA